MQINKKKDGKPCCGTEGVKTSVLLNETLCLTGKTNIVWVDLENGARQEPHSHDFPQPVILSGKGTMRIGTEEQAVEEGDLIVIPVGEEHTLAADGGAVSYLTLANKM